MGHHGLRVFIDIAETHGGGCQEKADDGGVAGIDLTEAGRRRHARGEQRHGFGDGSFHVHSGAIDIAAQIELQGDGSGTLAAVGDHRIQAGDARELTFQGGGDGVRHGVGIGSGQAGVDADGRVIDLREVAHAEVVIRNDAE
jgi:hypothetical protein